MNKGAIRSFQVTYNRSLYSRRKFLSVRTQIDIQPLRHHIVYIVSPHFFHAIAQTTTASIKFFPLSQTTPN